MYPFDYGYHYTIGAGARGLRESSSKLHAVIRCHGYKYQTTRVRRTGRTVTFSPDTVYSFDHVDGSASLAVLLNESAFSTGNIQYSV